MEVKVVTGPQALIRYNNRRAATVQGGAAPGVSSAQALKSMENVAARTLPTGFRGEWTDISYQEKKAEGKTGMILAFAVLFAYLFLVALYESWTIPVPVLAIRQRGRDGRLYRHIGRRASRWISTRRSAWWC